MKEDLLSKLIPPQRMGELFEPERRREHTLSVDAKSYEIITAVSEQTGKSRPKVLAAFIETAYYQYAEQATGEGIDPAKPSSGNHKGARKNKKRKKN